MKQLSLLVALVLSLYAGAQFRVGENSQQSQHTISSLQKDFYKWSKDKNLHTEKGWKQYKRWDEYYSQRMNLKGEMPGNNILLTEAMIYNQLKESYIGDEAWIPVGPDKWENEPYYQKGIGRINCVAFHPTETETLWVGVAQGGIWKTTNGGTSWMPINSNLPILRISDIAVDPTNPEIMYVCLGDIAYLGYSLNTADKVRQTHFGIGLYKTTDGGESWEPTGLTIDNTTLDYSLLKKVIINRDNTNELIVGGIEGIWQSEDAGETWEKKLDTMICDLELDPQNTNTIYAATCYIQTLNDGYAGVYKSTDFGDNWELLNTGIPGMQCQRVEIEIAPGDANYIYAIANNLAGGFHGIYQSIDGGENWTLKPNPENVNIFGWYEGVGEYGGQSTYDMVCLVDPSDKNVVYAGGVNLWGSSDGGETWNGVSYWRYDYGPSLHADQHRFSYNPLDDRFYMCNDGGIMRTDTVKMGSWDGSMTSWPTDWEYISDGMQITSFYRIGISQNNPDYLIGGAQDNSTYYYDSESWTNLFGGDGMECIIHNDDPDIIWSSSQYGNIGFSLDGGNSFYSTEYIPEYGSWTTPYLFNHQNNTFYVAKGNLYSSSDYGASLMQMSDFPIVSELGTPAPASSIAQSANNPEVFYVAKRLYHGFNVPSQLWVTKNNGATWVDITGDLPTDLYFSKVLVDDDNPDLAWLTVGAYEAGSKVFKTEDGGTSWVNISYNLPNIPANTLELDVTTEKHVVYLGTDLGVYYITDDTDEWQLWGGNLPNVIVTELEINYPSKELYVATFGRGIWKINTIDESTIAVNDYDTKNSFNCQLYPTQNKGSFAIEIDLLNSESISLEIINIMGAKVHAQSADLNKGTNKIMMNLSLDFGQYYLQIKTSNNRKVIPFIVD